MADIRGRGSRHWGCDEPCHTHTKLADRFGQLVGRFYEGGGHLGARPRDDLFRLLKLSSGVVEHRVFLDFVQHHGEIALLDLHRPFPAASPQ
eukprot:4420269-Prymnesium_polylepis.2